jgi:hypothetical protein
MDLNVIHVQLASVLRAIDQELTFLLPAESLPLAGTAAHARLCQKVSELDRQLDLVVRNLSSGQHALALESQRIRSLPRDLRYSSQQSVIGRRRNLDDAMRVVATVHTRLEQLFDRIGRPTGPEVLRALEKLITGAYNQVELTRAVTQELQRLTTKPSGPVIRASAPATTPDLLASIAIVGRLMHILAVRFLKGQRQ